MVDIEKVVLLFNLAADRCTTGSIQEAREAMSNVACDILRASNTTTNSANRGFALLVPRSLRLIPLYMLSMMKSVREREISQRLTFASFVSCRPPFERVVQRKLMIVHITSICAKLYQRNI